MPKPRNARFWIWWNNDWVKITLRPGQEITLYCGGPTDEGYSHEWETFSHEGDRIECSTLVEASDCDGRLDRYGEWECPLDQLQGIPEEQLTEWCEVKCEYVPSGEVLPPRPEWVTLSKGQRDYAAEAMGY